MTHKHAPFLALTVFAAAAAALPQAREAFAQGSDAPVPSLTSIRLETIRARDEALLRDLSSALLSRYPELLDGTTVDFTRIESYGTIFYRMDIQGIESEDTARKICEVLQMDRCLVARPGASVLASGESFNVGADGLVDMTGTSDVTAPQLSGSVDAPALPTQGEGWSPVSDVADTLSDLPFDRPTPDALRAQLAQAAEDDARFAAAQVQDEAAADGATEAPAASLQLSTADRDEATQGDISSWGTSVASAAQALDEAVASAIASTVASEAPFEEQAIQEGRADPGDLDATLAQARSVAAPPRLTLAEEVLPAPRVAVAADVGEDAPGVPPSVAGAIAEASVAGAGVGVDVQVAVTLAQPSAPMLPFLRPGAASGETPVVAVDVNAAESVPVPEMATDVAGLAIPLLRPDAQPVAAPPRVVDVAALVPSVALEGADVPAYAGVRPRPRPEGLMGAPEPLAMAASAEASEAFVEQQAVPVANASFQGVRPRPRPAHLTVAAPAEVAPPEVEVFAATEEGVEAPGPSKPLPVWQAGPRRAQAVAPAASPARRAPEPAKPVGASLVAAAPAPLRAVPSPRPEKPSNAPLMAVHAAASARAMAAARPVRDVAIPAAFAEPGPSVPRAEASARAPSSIDPRPVHAAPDALPEEAAQDVAVVEVLVPTADTIRPRARPAHWASNPPPEVALARARAAEMDEADQADTEVAVVEQVDEQGLADAGRPFADPARRAAPVAAAASSVARAPGAPVPEAAGLVGVAGGGESIQPAPSVRAPEGHARAAALAPGVVAPHGEVERQESVPVPFERSIAQAHEGLASAPSVVPVAKAVPSEVPFALSIPSAVSVEKVRASTRSQDVGQALLAFRLPFGRERAPWALGTPVFAQEGAWAPHVAASVALDRSAVDLGVARPESAAHAPIPQARPIRTVALASWERPASPVLARLMGSVAHDTLAGRDAPLVRASQAESAVALAAPAVYAPSAMADSELARPVLASFAPSPAEALASPVAGMHALAARADTVRVAVAVPAEMRPWPAVANDVLPHAAVARAFDSRLRPLETEEQPMIATMTAVALAVASPSLENRVVGQDMTPAAETAVAEAPAPLPDAVAAVLAASVVEPPVAEDAAMEVAMVMPNVRPRARPDALSSAAAVETQDVIASAARLAEAPAMVAPRLRPPVPSRGAAPVPEVAVAAFTVAPQEAAPRQMARHRAEAVPVVADNRPIHAFLALWNTQMPWAAEDLSGHGTQEWGPIAASWTQEVPVPTNAVLIAGGEPMPFALGSAPNAPVTLDEFLEDLTQPGVTFQAPPVMDFAQTARERAASEAEAALLASVQRPLGEASGLDVGIRERMARDARERADAFARALASGRPGEEGEGPLPATIRATVGPNGVVMTTEDRVVLAPRRAMPMSRFAVALSDTYAAPFDLVGTGLPALQRLPMARPAVVLAGAEPPAPTAALIAASEEGMARFFPAPDARDAAPVVPDAFAQGAEAALDTPLESAENREAEAPVTGAAADPALEMMERLRGGLDGTLETFAIPVEDAPEEVVAEAMAVAPAPAAGPSRPPLELPPLETADRPAAQAPLAQADGAVPVAPVAGGEAVATAETVGVAETVAEAPAPAVQAPGPVPFATATPEWPDAPSGSILERDTRAMAPALPNEALMVRLSYASSADEVTQRVRELMRNFPQSMLDKGRFYGAAAPASPGLYIVGIQAHNPTDRDDLVAYMTNNGIPFVLPGQSGAPLLNP